MPAFTGSGESVLVTDRSASASTVVVSVSELSAAVWSGLVVVTSTVFVRVEPSSWLALTLTTSVKVAVAPPASVALVAVKVPVPPTGGVVSVNAGPEVCIAETKVVLAGIRSLRLTSVGCRRAGVGDA